MGDFEERTVGCAEGADGGDIDETKQFLPDGASPNGGVTDLERKIKYLDDNTPRDRFYAVYIIMVVHGIGILMPWNMFITAKAYFEDHKLSQGSSNWTAETVAEVQEYRINFMAYIGMAAQFPNAAMNMINLFCQCGGKATTRIAISIVIMAVIFVITVILAMVDSSDWPVAFFWITLGSAVVLNSACGVYQNSLYGLAAILPMKYTNAIVFGNNLSGTFVSCVSIVTIALAPDIKTSAIYYFVTALLVLFIAFDVFFVLPLTDFFRHFQLLFKLKNMQLQVQTEDKSEPSCSVRLVTYWKVFKEIWVLALSVWFVFFLSLALFPQIQSDIKRVNFPLSDIYWTPIFCFLSFNLFAMLGNLATEFLKFPGPRFVWIPVLLRGLFIPLYLMCNFRPDSRTWPVLIPNDYVFIIVSVLMAFTSGYFSSLCMMYAPKKVASQNAGTAGMMMALFLVLGILCGVNFSRVLASLN